jgi:hypothetical protein
MNVRRRDAVPRLLALLVGAAVGLRTVQVMGNYSEQGGYNAIAAGGTLLGLMVTVALVGVLAAWRFNRSPDGTAGPRLVARAAGMVVGALVAPVLFGPP